MNKYVIYFYLSDLLHSVWQIPGQSTSLQMTQFHSFLWLSKYSIVCMYYIFFMHSSVNEYLGCFHILATVNSATSSSSAGIEIQM